MRTLREKLVKSFILALIILSLVPVTAFAQETAPLPWAQATVAGAEVTNGVYYEEVVMMAARAYNFRPGGPGGNPGTLIEKLDSAYGAFKEEHTSTAEWTLSGPKLFWGGIYSPVDSKTVLDSGALIVSCNGQGSILGTCILALPENVSITLRSTGATVNLLGFDQNLPLLRGPVRITEEVVNFPTKCVEIDEMPLSATELDGLAETAGPLYKAAGRDHNGTYQISVPQDMAVGLWTSGSVKGATLIGIDPDVAKIYFGYPGAEITVMASFQMVAFCAPEVDTDLGTSSTMTDTSDVSNAMVVPLDEVIRMLEADENIDVLAERYPNAMQMGDFDFTVEGSQMSGAVILLLGSKNPDENVWMNVGKTGKGPFVNYVDIGTVPDGYSAVLMSEGMDPDNDLSWR